MRGFIRRNRTIQAIRKLFIPAYDKTVYYIKTHKLFSGLCAILTVLMIILIIGLFSGWGVDKSVPGFYFKPEVEKCENENINDIVSNFYKADIAGDLETIKSLYIDPETLEEVKAKNNVIEYYDKYKIYWVKGLDDSSYVMYVYWEVKFLGIDTLAPGLEKFYVVSKDKNKTFYLKNRLTENEQDFVEQLAKSKDVEKLYAKTEANLEKALKDKDLKALYDYLVEKSKK